MEMDHAKQTLWPDFLKEFRKSHLSTKKHLVENTTSPDIEKILPLWEEKQKKGKCTGSMRATMGGKPISIFCFGLRDFLGQIDTDRPNIGHILIWADASEEMAAFEAGFRQNLWIAVIGFILIETVLLIFWRFGTRHFRRKVNEQTTELNQTNQQLLKARQKAEQERLKAVEANRSKDHFLAAMSHDIRTPMNAILGMSEMMMDTHLDEHQGHYTRVINNAGEGLLNLINDILDLSKIEADQLELESIPFDPREVVNKTVEILKPKALENGTGISTDFDLDTPPRLEGDPQRIQQVLLNLLSNAVKFTERGMITIIVTQTDKGKVRFSVADTGIGIPEGKQAAIFQPFQQAEASTTRRFGGTGLGLSICKKLSERMGERGHVF
jgi:signal transduction histidine kinase